ncbi:MAG: glutathione peroxidase [Alphaproteobacteria bacterium]|nr:glutathione peroxidase [Alphaproteobacteria bacterium]MDE2043313.1 glutathione peroxidase [Alphaproteobacteria bacterium]MDE2340573.1 glutathione peroxidase [Alphaproteobacteria bacterium]
MNVRDFTVKAADGSDYLLKDVPPGPILIVNVASKCGLTPQYEGLEKLYEDYKDKGLTILGFPCNQFGAQEPGTADEIASFCSLTYDVTFPILAKIEVNGAGADLLYKHLKSKKKGLLGSESIKWNFTKFLIGKDGNVLKRYAPTDKPESLREDIEAAL